MRTSITIITATAALALLTLDALAAVPLNKCTSIQARCAVEVGGTCNPATGRWRYGDGSGRLIPVFNACISRELARR